MAGHTSEFLDKQFFNDTHYLNEYINTSSSKQKELPGHAYYLKLSTFYDQHLKKGEPYMEYIKSGCQHEKGDICQFF